jgi:hypothetical protein
MNPSITEKAFMQSVIDLPQYSGWWSINRKRDTATGHSAGHCQGHCPLPQGRRDYS